MSDNIRKQIRDHYLTVLSGNTVAGTRVTTKRQRSQDQDRMPAISIITGDAVVDVLAMGNPPPLTHDLEVVFQCFSIGIDIDDQLDAISAEVHALVVSNVPGFVISFDLQNTNTAVDLSADRTGGSIALTYSLVYHTPGNDLTVAL